MAESSVEPSAHAAGERPPLGSLPLLVYDHGEHPNNRQTVFSIADQSLGTHIVPELTENNFHVTSHGWVVLQDPSSLHARLWNPRSGETIGLPATEHELTMNWKCYLSDTPNASSCIVLLLYMAEPKFLYCCVGDSCWTVHDYDIGNVGLPSEYAPPEKRVIHQMAAVDGKFYFLETGELGVIEFSPKPVFSNLDYPHAGFPDGSNCVDSTLVASRGELFVVNMFLKGFTPDILTVHVYKIDLSGPTTTLHKVDDLGDRAFLLSYTNEQMLCSASKHGLKGNRIYIMHNMMSEPDGGLMCIYDMDDQSLETVQPCMDMKDLMCDLFWMLPTDSDCAEEA
ncbi:hypothetical protein ACP70R_038773 [Stipagrostis hirtigluma subsp. patula]